MRDTHRFGEAEETLRLAGDDVASTVEHVLAQRLGDTDTLVGIFTAETVEHQIDAVWRQPAATQRHMTSHVYSPVD